MTHPSSRELENFKNEVGIKFQLYNSLFTSLPFHRIEKTGILLSLFHNHCEEGYEKGMSPAEIVNDFFRKFTSMDEEKEQTDLLFRFVQYAERQVVLFDAVEDAAFGSINDLVGPGSLKQLQAKVAQERSEAAFIQKLESFAVALVLTAHPTQFYPGPVLGIMNDLSKALRENNASAVNRYLQQLGKTPLYKKQRPTPYDEAVSLVWYLENVFYHAIGRIMSFFREQFPDYVQDGRPVVKMGFWPGGDRDGNPNVTTETTLKVAEALRSAIIKCYYTEVRRLRRRLTFKGVDLILSELETKLYRNIFIPGAAPDLTREEVLEALAGVKDILVRDHSSLFLPLLETLASKVRVFGLYFASLDIRQESSVHHEVLTVLGEKQGLLPAGYSQLDEEEKMDALSNVSGKADPSFYEGLAKDTIQCMQAVKEIQRLNGQEGCNRYVISQCGSALNVLEVYGLFLLSGWKRESLTVDIVPLFETIEDLKNAPDVMRKLYSHPVYRGHLERRGNSQTIMVGFSDGTKDGGYLMANWSIYKAKAELTKISAAYGIDVVFFDGRGGPPARGGGKTHRFYASMGKNISTKEIQLTVQGQTVSSNFGNVEAAQFNIEQLLNAGIINELSPENSKTLNAG
ncbi:MAG TPA: phosphoenolpyruvate carboxylase, partial [Flavisolibacter sp.]|nr:phosphoenolpyruvate carboxylase [Flavisolibacter sp.]